MNKDEIIKILTDEYGFEDSDLKDEVGKYFVKKQLQELLDEEEKVKEVDEIQDVKKEDEIDEFFDVGIQEEETNGFKDGDMITVMSGINGEYIHHSPDTGRAYRFRGFGQTAKVPYKELVAIRNLYPTVLEDGWLIVLNKDLINEFDLKDSYSNILTPKNSRTIFKKSTEEIVEFASSLPRAMKVTFVDLARKAYRKGDLDKMSAINAIQELFNISLEDNAPIHDTKE